MTAHRSAVAHTFALLAALTPIGCLFGDIHLDSEVASGGGSSTGSEGEPPQGVTGPSTDSGLDSSTGGPGTTGMEPATGSSGSEGSSGTTGEPNCYVVGPNQACACDGVPSSPDLCEPCEVWVGDLCYCGDTKAPMDWCVQPGCVLPHSASLSWCAAQREVAQVLGCQASNDPAACYQAITAQYGVGAWETVQAGDCDPVTDGPECAAAIAICTGTTPAMDCDLRQGDTVSNCTGLAVAAGMVAEQAQPWCEDMLAYYVEGCSESTQYRTCDLGCALPCAYGRECLGPDGGQVCTEPCTTPDTCPPTLFPNPWASPVCDASYGSGLCAVPDISGTCPNPGAYGSNGVGCWPYPTCAQALGSACDPECPVPCKGSAVCTDGLCA